MLIKNLKYIAIATLFSLPSSFASQITPNLSEEKKENPIFISLKDTADDWLILSESLVQKDSIEAFKRWDELLTQFPQNAYLLEQDFMYSITEGRFDRAIERGEAYLKAMENQNISKTNRRIVQERGSIVEVLKLIRQIKIDPLSPKITAYLDNIKDSKDISLIISLIIQTYFNEDPQNKPLNLLEKSFPKIMSNYIKLQQAYFSANFEESWKILQENGELYALIEANDIHQLVELFLNNEQMNKAKEVQLQWVKNGKNRKFFKIQASDNLAQASIQEKLAQTFMILGRIYSSAFDEKPNFRNQLAYHLAQDLDSENPFIDYNLARSYLSLNDYKKAKLFLKPLLEKEAVSARARYDYGLTLERDENFEEALSLYQQLEKEFPFDIPVLEMQADIHRRTENFNACIPPLDKAINLAKAQYPLNMNIDEEGKELPASVTALNIPPQALYLVFARGICYERLNNWEKAEPDLIWAAKQAPETPLILNYLAYGWTDRGYNLDEAEKMLKLAIEKFPNDGNIIDSLGWVYFRKNQLEEALKWLNLAANLEPAQGEILDHLGDTLWWLGHKRQALYAWQRVIDIDPKSTAAEKANYKLKTQKPIQIPGQPRIEFQLPSLKDKSKP